MNRARHSLPDTIPASYYARPAAAARGSGTPAWRRWVPDPRGWPLWRLRSVLPAHLGGGWGLAGCLVLAGLLAAGLLLAVRTPGSPSPTSADTATRTAPPSAPVALPVLADPSPAATPFPEPTQPRALTPTPRPAPSPTLAPAAITFLNAPLSSRGGQTVMLLVQTTPATSCSIDVGYQPPPGLGPATSSGTGGVSWTWRVNRRALPGAWPITVTCGGATATTQIVLT